MDSRKERFKITVIRTLKVKYRHLLLSNFFLNTTYKHLSPLLNLLSSKTIVQSYRIENDLVIFSLDRQ